jgi:YggT family protein
MMQAIYYVVDTLIGLYEAVLLLRLLLQLLRADFRNPIAQAIVKLTDPVILPLRRLLPPIGKLDSASVVAILLVAALKVWILHWLMGIGFPSALGLTRGIALDVLKLTLNVALFSIILNAILSFVAPGTYSPAQSLLRSLCEPVLRPLRKLIPPIAGLDLSPLWACIAIQALLLIIR